MHKRNRSAINTKILYPFAALLLAILACSAHYPDRITPEQVKDNDLSDQYWGFDDFCGLDLSGKDFSRSDLVEFIFQRVNLEGAIFRGADLSGANFQFAHLRNADFTGANLNNASFTYADLAGAILDEKWAKIMPMLVKGNAEGAQLQGYDLRNVNFQSFTPPAFFCDDTLFEWDQSFVFDLSRANLESALLDEANLYRARLQNANLRYATLISADLSGANLQDADLEGANLQKANFRIAHLSGANFYGADLSETNFFHADLRNTDLRQAIFEKTDLRYADLTGALIDPNQLQNAILRCTILPNGTIHNPAECGGDTPGAGDVVE